MFKPIRKAILPVAGLGTRFLPATKAIPKEMLPVVDRPILQYVIDEAREAGVEQFIFVTGRNKSVIADHFDIAYELDDTLRKRGKQKQVDALAADMLPEGAACFTRQQSPLGLGHAVWCARDLVGDQPFALLLPDMITASGALRTRCLAQCVETYREHGGNIVAVEEAPADQTQYYGVVAVGADFGHTFEIKGMVEKPAPGSRGLEPDHFRPIRSPAGNLRDSASPRKGDRRRVPIDRRHDRTGEDAILSRRPVRRANLRLRIEAGIPDRQYRLRAGTRRSVGGVAPGNQEARALIERRAASGSALQPQSQHEDVGDVVRIGRGRRILLPRRAGLDDDVARQMIFGAQPEADCGVVQRDPGIVVGRVSRRAPKVTLRVRA